jgi:hypothetical protein
MWDLWHTKWPWDRFISEFFGFSLSISFHCGSPYSYITWGMNNRPVRFQVLTAASMIFRVVFWVILPG